MGRAATIVLVTWNSAAYLPRCLDGIAQQALPDIEVVHVDNNSHDGSVAIVRATIPHATQILNATNRGFASAVNQGVKLAKGDVIFLLNPDAYLERDYVARIVAALRDDYGMATGTLLRARGFNIEPTKEIDSTGIRMTRSGRHLDITGKSPCEPFGVSGAAAAYTRVFIDDVSIDGEFLDEDFFAYREDADVAWRGRLFGWRAVYVPDAVAYHVRQVTPERRRALPPNLNMHSVKNRFLLRLKNEGWYLALRNAPFELARDAMVIGAALTIERTSLPAFGWLWRNRARVLAKRRAIQRKRRVSDRRLAEWFR